MNLSALLLLVGLIGSQRRPYAPAPSILGTWKLKSVQLITQRSDGTPPFAKNTRVTFGETTLTFKKDGRWTQGLYGSKWKEGTYQLANGYLTVYEGEHHHQEQIQELTTTQFVTVTETDDVPGVHVKAIETFVR